MPGIHEEEALGKAYDAKLMRRLLRYAAPYWRLLLVCVMLLFVITGTDLVQPYFTKIAIDDHINALGAPMLGFAPGREPVPGVACRGIVFVREKWLPRGLRLRSGESDSGLVVRAHIEGADGRYFLVTHDLESGVAGRQELTTEELGRFRQRDVAGVLKLALALLAAMVVGFLLNYLQVYILQYTSQKIIFNMRVEIFRHLQGLALSFFDRNPVGRLVTRVTNDTDALNEMYTAVLVNLFKDVFLLVGIVVMMLRMSFRLALVSLSVLPLILVVTVVFRSKAREAYRLVRTRLARINATLAENIAGMRIIQIFAREAKKFKEFDAINKEYLEANMRELRVYAVFRPAMDLMSSLALALLVWYGGGRVLAGKIEFGVLYAFISYIQQFFRPINDLTEKYNIMQSAMAASERIFMLLDTDARELDPEKPVSVGRPRGRIEFQNVWFAYNDEDWVLRDVSFTVEPGETCAFVGATGSGKTSIMNLIGRMYDVSRGRILIDGMDVRDIPRRELRRHIGVVQQDVFLFTGDIESNIRLHNTQIGDEDVREAARYVNADAFIDRLPGGYRAKVKERGVTLSMGQRQLLAFARALAFDPAILVLDEATANIDTETEALIQDALTKLVRGRTTLIVAHRLSTVQAADKIVVIHKGRVREIGTHQELLARRGIYYQLYLLQYKEEPHGDVAGEGRGELRG
ncbi:MAG: ABC transporter ATP-binding protein/permease [Firmicutes bacterium]|jgi:ATP-binding cassette subfamily B protein/subfamily B ATP-binding cassette protein MsbA|nr:ABC transporter ATP-binding protein/permease [Bacillota bacterium]MDH7494873.1 ABC transporter ATP-binding protein [Bacillota bacterium]